ncbi:MAG: LysM peptidoglycan-binding domain-containing protein [Pirellula sp.]|jgi:LysM repeat protein|nr:LysM peptidoglycan-binding domain-containing protein [Pirellula sp.]
MNIYTVVAGDTLSKIATQHKISSWQELYNHPANLEFRKKRSNPNLIYPGDKIVIPGPVIASNQSGNSTQKYGKLGKHLEAMQKEAQKSLSTQQWNEFLKFLEDTKGDWDKATFFFDRVEDAVLVVQYFKVTSALQLPISDIKHLVPVLAKVREGDKIIKALIAPGSKLASALKALGTTGKVVSFMGLAIQCFVHYRRQDYYAMASEIYRTGLGLGLPWAGLADGIESVVSSVVGPSNDSQKDKRFWKYLRALNVVGLGASGVDSVGTMIHLLVSKDYDPDRMTRLIERLRASPAQVFLEMGEDLDKSLTYFSEMPKKEFDELMTINNFYNWIRYELTGKLP